MKEIQVGDYVRTDNGIIGKYIIQQSMDYINTGKQYIGIDIEKDIVKHSPNIIDLIEVGDYVNGWKVLSIVTTYDKPDEIGIKFLGFDNLLYDIDIKSIVTKEQFKSVEYKLEE